MFTNDNLFLNQLSFPVAVRECNGLLFSNPIYDGLAYLC